MSVSGKITRWNAYQLSSYEQMQFYRERRAAVREEVAKMNAQASGLVNIQVQNSVGMGDIVSRVAMSRMAAAKKA